MMEDESAELSEQVLVERSGTYELVDSRNLLTPEVDQDSHRETEDEVLGKQQPEPDEQSKPDVEPQQVAQPEVEAQPQPDALPQPVAQPQADEGEPTLSVPVDSVTDDVAQRTRVPIEQPDTTQTINEGAGNTDTSVSPEADTKPARPRSARRPQVQPPVQPHTTQNQKIETTTINTRQTKRPMSARSRQVTTPRPVVSPSLRAMSAQPARKTPHQRDEEAIQRRAMADSAFDHWKRQKDRESAKKRKDKLHETVAKVAWEDQRPRDDTAFKAWLAKKTKQQADEREVEQIRAKVITAELMSMDYGENELAYERWLKNKNKSKRIQKKEMTRKSKENREEMKAVLHSIKTRWMLDYKKSNYLHPNARIGAIWGWDNSPLYDATL